jgi:hypothetical protein
VIKQRLQIGAADAGDIDPRILQSVQQRVIDRIKEVDALDGLVVDPARLGKPVERADTGREVVQRRQMLQVAAITAEQDLAQVDQAVDAFLDRCEIAGWRALPVFHLPVVLEEGHVVGGRLDAKDLNRTCRTS